MKKAALLTIVILFFSFFTKEKVFSAIDNEVYANMLKRLNKAEEAVLYGSEEQLTAELKKLKYFFQTSLAGSPQMEKTVFYEAVRTKNFDKPISLALALYLIKNNSKLKQKTEENVNKLLAEFNIRKEEAEQKENKLLVEMIIKNDTVRQEEYLYQLGKTFPKNKNIAYLRSLCPLQENKQFFDKKILRRVFSKKEIALKFDKNKEGFYSIKKGAEVFPAKAEQLRVFQILNDLTIFTKNSPSAAIGFLAHYVYLIEKALETKHFLFDEVALKDSRGTMTMHIRRVPGGRFQIFYSLTGGYPVVTIKKIEELDPYFTPEEKAIITPMIINNERYVDLMKKKLIAPLNVLLTKPLGVRGRDNLYWRIRAAKALSQLAMCL